MLTPIHSAFNDVDDDAAPKEFPFMVNPKPNLFGISLIEKANESKNFYSRR